MKGDLFVVNYASRIRVRLEERLATELATVGEKGANLISVDWEVFVTNGRKHTPRNLVIS